MLSPSAVSVYSGMPNPSYSPGEFSTLTLAEEMRNLHLGQSYDLHWSHHSQKPTPEEYFNMVDGSKYLFDLSSLSIQLVDNW